jgi:hypothetical protein
MWTVHCFCDGTFEQTIQLLNPGSHLVLIGYWGRNDRPVYRSYRFDGVNGDTKTLYASYLRSVR